MQHPHKSLARCLTLAGALAFNPASWATVYTVSIDTSALAGSSAQLAFDFIDGGLPSNSVLISGFTSNGTLGTQVITGDVSGSLPGSVTLSDTAFFSELLAGFTLGNTLSFRFEPSAKAPDAVPDAFSFFLLDDTGSAPLFDTTDPSGSGALLRFDIDASAVGGLNVFAAMQNQARITVTSDALSVPEPSSAMLLGLGLLTLRLRRRQQAGQEARP